MSCRMPGKNSASLESGGIAVLSRQTRQSPIALRRHLGDGLGLQHLLAVVASPWFSIMRTNFR